MNDANSNKKIAPEPHHLVQLLAIVQQRLGRLFILGLLFIVKDVVCELPVD
jgi:hypothetical protein